MNRSLSARISVFGLAFATLAPLASAQTPAAPAAPAKAAGAENGTGSVRTTITYDVKCNGKTHKVTVAPAR